jgi:hypothetical protein
MTSVTLTFIGHVPSKKNSRQGIQHKGRLINLPSKAYQRWEKAELATLHNAPAIHSPVSIRYEFWVGGKSVPREFDLSNAEESINDLLVKAGVIEDDSWLHLIRRDSVLAGFIQGESKTVVTVEHVHGETWRDAIAILKSPESIAQLAQLQGTTKATVKREQWKILEEA